MNSDESIFRFISIRTGEKSKERETFRVHCRKTESLQTSTHKLLATAKADNDPTEILRICGEFRKKTEYIDSASKLELDLGSLDDWIQNHSTEKFDDRDFIHCIHENLGKPVGEIVNTASFKTDWENITDTIIAMTIMKTGRPEHTNFLMRTLKILRMLELFDAGMIDFSSAGIADVLRKMQVILPDDIFPLIGEEKPSQTSGTASGSQKPKESDSGKILAELRDLQSAYKELSGIKASFLASDIDKEKTDKILAGGKLTQKPAGSSQKTEANIIDQALEVLETKVNLNTLTIPKETAQYFTPTTKHILNNLKIDQNAINPKQAKAAVKSAITSTLKSLLKVTKKEKVLKLGGLVIAYDKLKEFFSARVGMAVTPTIDFDVIGKRLASYVAGVGELLLVKQKLKGYQLSDFAHIENVLAGESKERTHRRKNVTEQEELYREETEETTEKDLQSTDRHEMQNEAERTVKNDLKIEAGLKVSGSYGPAVKFEANAGASYNLNIEETKRKSSTFAKEVTERTVESIKKKVIEERVKRVQEEIEEINIHGIDNENNNQHIVGVYRWLNKIYDAQIFNYGKRMMLEFVIPEPSANYLYAILENPPEDSIIPKPEEPMNIENTEPLRPEHITELNYEYWVSKYEVTNAPVPPEEEKCVVFHRSQITNKKHDVYTATVDIPEGYQAVDVVAHTLVWMPGGNREDWWFCFYIGDARFYYRGNIQHAHFNSPFANQVAVTIRSFDNITGYGAAAHVLCEPTETKLQQWRQDMYDAIMEAYWRQKSDYEEAMAAASIAEGVQILGNNPLENRRIEQNELKRLAVALLTRQEFDGFNSIIIGDDGWPRLNFDRIDAEGTYIRFFENAFEWNNITYIFYPYFWGQRNNWAKYLHFEDPDPDFAAFLKAGAVRLMVPVRPGFENSVTYFIQNREIWEGGDAPLIGDDQYVSVTQEVAESLNAPDNAEPYGDAWEVIVPTSLVALQNLEQIPGIRDVLTDNTINLGNGNDGADG